MTLAIWPVIGLFAAARALRFAMGAISVDAEHLYAALSAYLLAITTMTVFLSEVTSNTAQVATMVPVLAAMAPQLGIDPYALIIACTLGASSAYMMPVGTPPNAIVFGTGLVRMPQMMKAGVWLNLAGILVITTLTALLL